MEDALIFLNNYWYFFVVFVLFFLAGYGFNVANRRWERQCKEWAEQRKAAREKAREEYLADWKQQVAHYEQPKKPPVKPEIKEVKPRPVIPPMSKEERRAYKERARKEEVQDRSRRADDPTHPVIPVQDAHFDLGAHFGVVIDPVPARVFGGGNSDGGGASGSWESSSSSGDSGSSGGSDSGGGGGD